jgi:mono/diheme cytochrome c family protein
MPYEDSPVNTGLAKGTTNFVELNPMKVDARLLARGQQRYTINCSPCHGQLADGNGITKKYGMTVVANLHDKRIVEMGDGEIFHVISHGRNLMQSYASQVDVPDRWAIVAYLRALQLARLGGVDDVPEAERATLPK